MKANIYKVTTIHDHPSDTSDFFAALAAGPVRANTVEWETRDAYGIWDDADVTIRRYQIELPEGYSVEHWPESTIQREILDPHGNRCQLGAHGDKPALISDECVAEIALPELPLRSELR